MSDQPFIRSKVVKLNQSGKSTARLHENRETWWTAGRRSHRGGTDFSLCFRSHRRGCPPRRPMDERLMLLDLQRLRKVFFVSVHVTSWICIFRAEESPNSHEQTGKV